GIEVRGADVLASDWDCTLEEALQAGAEAPPAQTAPGDAPGRAPAYVAAADGSAIDWRAQPAVRLGLNRVRGLSQASAQRLLDARAVRRRARGDEFAFDSVEDLAREARLDARELQALAQADALRQLAGHRAQAHWEAAAIR